MHMKTIFDIYEKVEERKKYKFIRQANRLFKNTKFYVCYNCSSVFETGVLNDGTAEEICNCKSCKNSNNLLTISEGIK